VAALSFECCAPELPAPRPSVASPTQATALSVPLSGGGSLAGRVRCEPGKNGAGDGILQVVVPTKSEEVARWRVTQSIYQIDLRNPKIFKHLVSEDSGAGGSFARHRGRMKPNSEYVLQRWDLPPRPRDGEARLAICVAVIELSNGEKRTIHFEPVLQTSNALVLPSLSDEPQRSSEENPAPAVEKREPKKPAKVQDGDLER
jgi:hypothetical protein